MNAVASRVVRVIVAVALATALVGMGHGASSAPRGGLVPWFSQTSSGISVSGTYTPLVGNFAGDMRDDIIWYAPGAGTESLWVATGTAAAPTFAKSRLSRQVNGTFTPVVGDFAGGLTDDIIWYAPGTAPDVLWANGANATFTSSALSINGTYKPVVLRNSRVQMGAYDDIIWYAPGTATDSLWLFSPGGHTGKAVTVPGSPQPVLGDFDGNYYMDVFWYGAGSAPDQLWRLMSSGGSLSISSPAVNGTYTAVTAEQYRLPSDGRADLLFWSKTGADTLWAGRADGGFDKATVSVNPIASGRAIPGHDASGVGYQVSWSTTDITWVWQDSGTPGTPIDRPLGNAAIPAGYQPLVLGRTANAATAIFWYAPGASPEWLFHM